MKKTILLLIVHLLLATSYGQQGYWQQEVNYTIDVSLNDKDHSLDGFETIEYINNSPDTLKFIWFHLWPNAYKNDKTAFCDQSLENGSTRFYFSKEEERGYINKLDFKVNNITASTEDHPQHIDIIKLLLPSPLPPGQKINITTSFHVKLPFNFSRGGHDGQSYQATQWYPKPAVYDKEGWHPMPYLDQGEFYSEFGKFKVTITVPKNYVVAATGELQNKEEKEWLKQRTNYTWEPVKQTTKNAYGQVKKTTEKFPPSDKELKTLVFKQENIHDFAWFADKRFIVNYDTCILPSGREIEVVTYYTSEHKHTWGQSAAYTKDAVRHYSQVGEYPYSIAQAVQGPESFGGGMEYPTITVIAPTQTKKGTDVVIAHEVGHNWFYGILGSNERKYPWMDEGINSYYDQQYSRYKYNEKSNLARIAVESVVATKSDQPIADSSAAFNWSNYGLMVYMKTAEWMKMLEQSIGATAFNTAMQEYYRRWKFKHPQPEDFKQVLEESTGKNLDSLFGYLYRKGALPIWKRSGTQFGTLISKKTITTYANSKANNLITVSPMLGANSYDKFMLGIVVTNIKFPPNRFRFFAVPLFATGTKKLTGLGSAWYSFYPEKTIRRIEIGADAATFTMNSFKDDFGKTNFTGFRKIVPGIKLTLAEKNARSTKNRFIQFKSFLISEDEFDFYRDTVISGPDTSIGTRVNIDNTNRTLNQLKLVIEDYRVLYPYRGELKLEQGKDFLRAAFTGNYYFNYPGGGGLDVRFFAGKFFYTGGRTTTKEFATDRYHLNMTGPNGYEDYTYSDYFIGRNEFEGLSSQQIMIRDGAFKIRTDLLADKVGRSDDWLIAANFGTTIPSSINPLSVLPVKIPLKLFLDIGTYSDAWKRDAGLDRFIFDAGLHIPLLKETINIYIPLIYSKIYKDYLTSTTLKKERFLKKISFSIDISNFNLRKIDRNLNF